ncbi:alpha/beta hydrolase [Antarcticibacterium sp. 1MA-6-2]|uniref:alpha/beta hydrolase n=1 Tax=Antarcticibacterium sp. 1MA-6-2 TaxID=2908210 RepID=UPI001F31D54B|nr:alpha/beta hydrolase [Antarcticibacterium sp. 1MA-6-2]UJH91034.1 alpha/beta hydrolase [Antarcticibacterium sp. 1MA-6-2]
MLSYAQQETLSLWPDGIPNSEKSNEKEIQNQQEILSISKVQEPSIEVYLPSKRLATGQAVVICPGGGYGFLSYDWEGTDFAKWLNSKGIAGVVLKYRLPDSKSVIESYKAPLQDVQRAIRLVRANSEKWNIQNNKVGIMGFSAGGHLAASLATRFDEDYLEKEDAVDKLSARPDFSVLVYPVISMKNGITHGGSRRNLLGENAAEELVNQFSNELQVTKDTPPTFLVHTADDTAVPVENSLLFYKALTDKDIPAEMHLYPKGGHGFAMAKEGGYLATWTDRLSDWLESLSKNGKQ